MRLVWANFLLIFTLAFSCLASNPSQLKIGILKIEGSDLNRAALMRILGLQEGKSVAASDLQTATDHLVETGLFDSVNYKYEFSATEHSYVVTFQLEQPKEFSAVQLDLGDVDETAIWSYLASNAPAYVKKVPPSTEAQNLYARAVETYLSGIGRSTNVEVKSFAASINGNGTSTVILQAKDLPHIRSIEIQGAKLISEKSLRLAERSLINLDYSRLTFPKALLASIRVDCEDLGLLDPTVSRVAAKAVSPQQVDLAVSIDEGPVYRFGAIEVTDVPELNNQLSRKFSPLIGKTANMREFFRIATTLDRDLAQRGLTVTSGYETRLDRQERTMSILVHARRKK